MITSLAAVGSILAASTCCLPVLPFVAAAGLAGGSAFLSQLRPYLLGLAVVLIASGFYRASRAGVCRRKPGILGSVILWSSAVYVGVAIFFPQVMANAAAALLAGRP